MTATEFRYEFDLLYNNIMSDMAPGLDDYEVSMFLSRAQEEIVTQLYTGGASIDGFESSEKVRRNLANLIHTNRLSVSNPTPYGNYWAYPVALAPTLLVITAERAEVADPDCCDQKKWITVTPTKYDEINKVVENPFRRPNNRHILRMDTSTTSIKLISDYIVTKYEYDWLEKPKPIIVANLPSGYTIDGDSAARTSSLDESLHRPIVKYAVQLAAASWASNNKS